MLPWIMLSSEVIHAFRVLDDIGHDHEWMGELWGRELSSNRIIVEKLLLHKQQVSRSRINDKLDKATRSAYRHETLFYHQQQGRLEGVKLVGWAHSHVYAGSFLSATDLTQIRQYLKEIGLVISVVVSRQSAGTGLFRWFRSPRDRLGFRVWLHGTWKGMGLDGMELRKGKEYDYNSRFLEDKIDSDLRDELCRDYTRLVCLD